MGNESGKQEETPENQAEEIQKDEIPADTQQNNQYLENSLKKEDQDRKNIIIKEKHFENNEDGIQTKVDERRVEYHISKVNQDNDENVESAENIEYDENAEQMEDNAEGEYEMNQQEQDPLSQILRNALSGNDSLRKEAESQITRLASENLSEFLIKISSKISKSQVIRQIY